MWRRLENRITLEVHINIICPSVVVLQVWSQEHPYEHQRGTCLSLLQHILGKPAPLGCASSCSDTH